MYHFKSSNRPLRCVFILDTTPVMLLMALNPFWQPCIVLKRVSVGGRPQAYGAFLAGAPRSYHDCFFITKTVR